MDNHPLFTFDHINRKVYFRGDFKKAVWALKEFLCTDEGILYESPYRIVGAGEIDPSLAPAYYLYMLGDWIGYYDGIEFDYKEL